MRHRLSPRISLSNCWFSCLIVSPSVRGRDAAMNRSCYVITRPERDNITRTKPTNLCELRLKPPLIASSCDAVAFFFSTWRTFLKVGSYFADSTSVVGYWVLWASSNEAHRIDIYHLELLTGTVVESHHVVQCDVTNELCRVLGARDIYPRIVRVDCPVVLPEPLFALVDREWFVDKMLDGIWITYVI